MEDSGCVNILINNMGLNIEMQARHTQDAGCIVQGLEYNGTDDHILKLLLVLNETDMSGTKALMSQPLTYIVIYEELKQFSVRPQVNNYLNAKILLS